ncbi:MAG: type II/IV secretion system ATPase subunit [Nitrososphaerota archaeon]|nr:type II/IV secretion system ATPase subunit [Nitrososphaerota archaeon]
MSIFKVFRRPKITEQQASLQQQSSKKKVQSVGTAIQTFHVDQLPTTMLGEIIDEYKIGEEARVTIADEGGHARYIISEPQLTEEEEDVYSLIMNSLYFSMDPIPNLEDPARYIENYIWQAAEEKGIVDQVRKAYPKYRYYIMRDSVVGYEMIDALIRDKDVEEISCEAFGRPVAVIHRKYSEYDWLDTNVVYRNEDQLRSFVQKLAHKAGRSVTIAVPYLDAIMKEGHRLALTLGDEITLPGSTFSIRKFPEEPLSIGHLLKFGTLSSLMAAYYWLLAEYRGFAIVVGPMSSGKTTMLNALATMISPNVKIDTIEDTVELVLPHIHHLSLKTRKSYSISESKFDVEMFGLVKYALRTRPDYVAVGEIRGEEASTTFQAGMIGHGLFTSFHANSPRSALVRLSTPPLNIDAGALLSISSFLMMNRVRAPGGKFVRRAVSSSEVKPSAVDGKTPELLEVFRWNARTDEFAPTTSGEVVAKSYQLRELVMSLTGWDETQLVGELDRRREFLDRIVSENRIMYSEVSEALQGFYRRRPQQQQESSPTASA